MSSRTNNSAPSRANASGSGSGRGPERKSSKRKHSKKYSRSRSSRGSKKTKFSSPNAPQHRSRRRPFSASQSRICPHRQGRQPNQFFAAGFPGFSRNHPLLVPSISSFYPPGASPLVPGTPVNIPGLPPLIAGNPVPLPPGFFPPSTFTGLPPVGAFAGPMMGGGGAQQPIVLPFPIPMPMPMPTSGGSHPPIVIPAPPPPPAPPSYPPPMPYPVAGPAAQGGGGSDTMALMMMMKSMQQERQAAAQQREQEEERRQEEKVEAEKRERRKEKEEEKKRKKKEKEEERKRKKEEREKALEERKKEIERMQEENKRQIEEAQKKVEEAAAKKKAEKEEALAKKAAEEAEAKKKKMEEEEKAKKEAEAKAAATGDGDAPPKDPPKDATAANVPAEAHPHAAGEEDPLLAAQDPLPDPMAFQAPAHPLPDLDLGVDLNPALQMTEPSGAGRILCFILLGLVIFLGVVVALLYFFAPEMLPFLVTPGASSVAAASAESTGDIPFRGEVINIDNTPVRRGEGSSTVAATTRDSSMPVLTVNASTPSQMHTKTTVAPFDINTIEIALNDRHWAGATDWIDHEQTPLAMTSPEYIKRKTDILSFRPVGVTTVLSAKGSQTPRYRRPRKKLEMGNQTDGAMAFVTALTLDAFLDQGYRKNLKVRLFGEDSGDANKKAASRNRASLDYDNIWSDEDAGDEKVAATRVTFDFVTKSPIRELLESVQGAKHRDRGVRQSAVSRGSPSFTREEATPVIADDNAYATNARFTTESETTLAGGLTLEDFKIYTIARVDHFKGVFEKAFKELKNARKKPVK